MMMKVDTGKVTAECAEGMNVAVANPGPVAKFNAKLERRAGARHEIGFIQPELGVVEPDVRHSGFADADRADFRGFQQLNFGQPRRQQLGKRRRSHPPSGAATDNQDTHAIFRMTGKTALPSAVSGWNPAK